MTAPSGDAVAPSRRAVLTGLVATAGLLAAGCSSSTPPDGAASPVEDDAPTDAAPAGGWQVVPPASFVTDGAAPAERTSATAASPPAVWTGKEAVFVGAMRMQVQDAEDSLFGPVPILDPATPAWRLAPAPPYELNGRAATAWIGEEVAVLDLRPTTQDGKAAAGAPATRGAALRPDSTAWRSLTGLREIFDPNAVWTGKDFLLWSTDDRYLPVTTRYDPKDGIRNDLDYTTAPVPAPGSLATWTGTELMAVSGDGANAGAFNTDEATWRPLPTPPLLQPSAVAWTGKDLLVFSGSSGRTSRFDPTASTWREGAKAPFAVARPAPPSVWTGSKLVIWGGTPPGGTRPDGAAVYDPATDTWTTLPLLPNTESPLTDGVWAGDKVLLWGFKESSAAGRTTTRFVAATLVI